MKNRERMKKEAIEESEVDKEGEAISTGAAAPPSVASKLGKTRDVAAPAAANPSVGSDEGTFRMPTEDSKGNGADGAKGEGDPNPSTEKGRNNRGKLMELFEVQLLVVACIGLDIVFSTMELIMTYNVTSLSIVPLNVQMSLLRVIQSFTG